MGLKGGSSSEAPDFFLFGEGIIFPFFERGSFACAWGVVLFEPNGPFCHIFGIYLSTKGYTIKHQVTKKGQQKLLAFCFHKFFVPFSF